LTVQLEKLTGDGLIRKANEIRKSIVHVSVKNGAGHIAPSLSCVDILVALYYNIMTISDNPLWEDRDRLIFSKAHGCYGVYAILADLGYIDQQDWLSFYQGSSLMGCIEHNAPHGIEASCGSLGHGLPIATGIAFGAKLQNKRYQTYCIIGDGELQEGSNWEAIQFAVKHKLSNMTLIIDNNRLQAMDFLENVLTPEGKIDDIEKKMAAFGCVVKSCEGHDVMNIVDNLKSWINKKEQLSAPQVLIARTIKGYGLKCMENIPKFHFRVPTDDEMKQGNRYE